MFQRALILVAISAAFASGFPPPISPCDPITEKLQRALSPKDPHTFPIISNVDYIHYGDMYKFDFSNLTLKRFSYVNCTSFHDFEQESVATLTFEGPSLEFDTDDVVMRSNQSGFPNPLKIPLLSWLYNYTLELSFEIDSYRSYPFSLCISRNSLEMTFNADEIWLVFEVSPRQKYFSKKVAKELFDHPDAVFEAINRYLPRFANNFTTTLNDILCSEPISSLTP
ncbi:uncharacterized protein [Palaemon carinicauda]|uniref:uncharacterized protein n=1 Tax=Palaemon carinicauda TaxID=392227 RepID=UPI0035B577C4